MSCNSNTPLSLNASPYRACASRGSSGHLLPEGEGKGPLISKGFTLIELIVSLTLMAMVSAAVLSGLRTGLLVWNKGTAHIDDLRRSRVVLQLLRESIGGTLPFMYAPDAQNRGLRRLAFEATHEHLQYVSRTSFKDGPNSVPRWVDIRWVHDSTKPTKSSGALVVEERAIVPPYNLPAPDISWTGKVLEAESCSFDSLEVNPTTSAVAWIPDWRPPSEQLPKAIRIRCHGQSGEIVSLSPLDYVGSFTAGLRLN